MVTHMSPFKNQNLNGLIDQILNNNKRNTYFWDVFVLQRGPNQRERESGFDTCRFPR